jgi:hypothetical protein
LSKDFQLQNAPPDLWLRVFQEGKGAVEVRGARLFMRQRSDLITAEAALVHPSNGRLSGDTFHLDADGSAQIPFHLPVRPMTVELEAEASLTPTAPVSFGIAPDERGFDDQTELSLRPEFLGRPRRFTRTVALPADVAEVVLRAKTNSKSPVVVHSLRAHDACRDHQYQPVRPLERGLWLYRNLDAMPRAYTVSKLVPVENIEGARVILHDAGDFDAKTTATVESPPEGPLFPGWVKRSRFGAQTFDAMVEAPAGPTFLVVNDHFEQHWTATIDGTPVPIFRTNGLVRGVRVPQGRHHVAMEYRAPASVWIGLVLGAFGLLVGAVVTPRIHAKLPLLPERSE